MILPNNIYSYIYLIISKYSFSYSYEPLQGSWCPGVIPGDSFLVDGVLG